LAAVTQLIRVAINSQLGHIWSAISTADNFGDAYRKTLAELIEARELQIFATGLQA